MKSVLTTLSFAIGIAVTATAWSADSNKADTSTSSAQEKVDEIIEKKKAEHRAAGASEEAIPSSKPAESWTSGCTPKGAGTESNAQACAMSETAKRTLPPKPTSN